MSKTLTPANAKSVSRKTPAIFILKHKATLQFRVSRALTRWTGSQKQFIFNSRRQYWKWRSSKWIIPHVQNSLITKIKRRINSIGPIFAPIRQIEKKHSSSRQVTELKICTFESFGRIFFLYCVAIELYLEFDANSGSEQMMRMEKIKYHWKKKYGFKRGGHHKWRHSTQRDITR